MAEKKTSEPDADRSFTSGKGVTLTAKKNIPLSRVVSDMSKIPVHLRKHPGGARVEKGTKIHVSKAIGEGLQAEGLAE